MDREVTIIVRSSARAAAAIVAATFPDTPLPAIHTALF